MEAEANKNRSTSEGWSGNEAEFEWVNYVIASARKKTEKTPTYLCKCQKIWLLIYVNLPPISIGYEDALSMLMPKLENFWHADQWFDALYIMHGSRIISVKPEGWSKMFVHDLWNPKNTSNGPNDATSAESDEELWNRVVHTDLREIEFSFDADDEIEKE